MGRRGEKKVAVWRYEKDKAALEVVVYLVDLGPRDYSGREDGARTFFRVEIPDLGINEDDTDINKLKISVWKELDQKLSIKWTDWLYVSVDGNIDTIVRRLEADDDPVEDLMELVNRQANCSISIKYERLQLGQIGNQKMQRDFNNYHEGRTYYETAREGWPEVGRKPPAKHRWGTDNQQLALVPDTAENRAALDAISDGFGNLLKRLGEILSPEKAQSTLTNIKTTRLIE